MIRDMAEPTMSIADVDAMLTGEGGFFETVPVIVNGVEVTTAKNRAPHLRALLLNSANHGGDGSAPRFPGRRPHPPGWPPAQWALAGGRRGELPRACWTLSLIHI